MLVIVKAKEGPNNSYLKPAVSDLKPEDIAFKPDKDGGMPEFTGFQPGDIVYDDEYYAIYYNDDTQEFIGNLGHVQGFTVGADTTPNLDTNPTNDGATTQIDTGNSQSSNN